MSDTTGEWPKAKPTPSSRRAGEGGVASAIPQHLAGPELLDFVPALEVGVIGIIAQGAELLFGVRVERRPQRIFGGHAAGGGQHGRGRAALGELVLHFLTEN